MDIELAQALKETAEAKGLLRKLKSLIEDVCDINYLSKDNCKLLVEVERFLISPDDRFEVTKKGKEVIKK
jgi:hypothetical protein